MEKDTNPIINAHYNGTFVRSPLMYFDAYIASIPYKVVNKMTFPDFTHFLEKLTNVECKDVYFFPHKVSFSEGFHAIQNECDFNKFLEVSNGKKRLYMCVGHYHEPLFDWIQEEEANLEDDLVYIDDVDLVLKDGLKT